GVRETPRRTPSVRSFKRVPPRSSPSVIIWRSCSAIVEGSVVRSGAAAAVLALARSTRGEVSPNSLIGIPKPLPIIASTPCINYLRGARKRRYHSRLYTKSDGGRASRIGDVYA